MLSLICLVFNVYGITLDANANLLEHVFLRCVFESILTNQCNA